MQRVFWYYRGIIVGKMWTSTFQLFVVDGAIWIHRKWDNKPIQFWIHEISSRYHKGLGNGTNCPHSILGKANEKSDWPPTLKHHCWSQTFDFGTNKCLFLWKSPSILWKCSFKSEKWNLFDLGSWKLFRLLSRNIFDHPTCICLSTCQHLLIKRFIQINKFSFEYCNQIENRVNLTNSVRRGYNQNISINRIDKVSLANILR